MADKATPIVRTGEVTGKPIGRDTSHVAQDGPTNLPVAGVATGPSEAKFDRIAYQREYMRGYRKRQAERKAKNA